MYLLFHVICKEDLFLENQYSSYSMHMCTFDYIHRSQKRPEESVGFPELQRVVGQLMYVLGTKPWSSERTLCTLNHLVVSPAPQRRAFLKKIIYDHSLHR